MRIRHRASANRVRAPPARSKRWLPKSCRSAPAPPTSTRRAHRLAGWPHASTAGAELVGLRERAAGVGQILTINEPLAACAQHQRRPPAGRVRAAGGRMLAAVGAGLLPATAPELAADRTPTSR